MDLGQLQIPRGRDKIEAQSADYVCGDNWEEEPCWPAEMKFALNFCTNVLFKKNKKIGCYFLLKKIGCYLK